MSGTASDLEGSDKSHPENSEPGVTDPSVTRAHKVGPGLQDLQKWGQRILAKQNAEKAEENMWIGQMVVAKSITELDGLIRLRAT